MKLCSACLLGVKCRYDGRSKENSKVMELKEKESLIPVCPEELGGLETPRAPSEIMGGSGEDVLDGKCRVKNSRGEDVTEEFVKGAREVLRIAKERGIKEAILKQRSPSCGFGELKKISGGVFEGNGVTAALLNRNGIEIITEEEL